MLSDIIFNTFFKKKLNITNPFKELEELRESKLSGLIDKKSSLEKERNDLKTQINLISVEEQNYLKSKSDYVSSIESNYQNTLQEIEREYSYKLKQADKILDEYETVKQGFENKYSLLLSHQNQYIKYVKDIIDDYRILVKDYNIDLEEDINTYEPKSLALLAKENAEEINYLENKNTDFVKAKSSSVLSSPLTAFGGMLKAVKEGSNLRRDLNDIKVCEEQIVWAYKALKYQKEKLLATKEKSEPNREQFENKRRLLMNTAREEYEDSKIKAENRYKIECKNNENSSDSIDFDEKRKSINNEIDIITSRLRTINENYDEIIKELKEALNEFKSKQNKDILNPKYSELTKEKATYQKYLSIHNEYDSMKDFTYTTDLPENTKLDRYWFKLLEKERIYKARFSELENKIKDIPSLNEVNKRLFEIEEELKNLFKIETSDLRLGINSRTFEIDDNINEVVNYIFRQDLQTKPILITYDTLDEREELIKCLKFVLFNFLGQFHPRSISVNVLDKKQSFDTAGFQINLDKVDEVTKKIVKGDDYVKVISDEKEVTDYITSHKKYISGLITKELSSRNFQELVNDRIDKGAIVPKFRVNIIFDENLDHQLLSLNTNGKDLGVLNILFTHIDNIVPMKDNNGELCRKTDYEIMKKVSTFGSILEYELERAQFKLSYISEKNCVVFKTPILDNNWFNEKKELLRERYLNDKPTSNDLKSFIENVIGTPDKWFKNNMEKDIKLYVGYVEGDKSQAIPIVLDEKQAPHLFIAGTTGGGKSNVLSVIYNTLKCTYAPTDVNVTYIDFKIVEVALHVEPYKSPNASLLSGSQEPEYIKSVMLMLYNKMMKRYSYLEQMGFKELSSLRAYQKKQKEAKKQEIEQFEKNNSNWLFDSNLREQHNKLQQEYESIEVTPREVIILDELTQGLKSKDEEVKSTIVFCLTKILELGRANGFHLVALTQDASNLPDTMLSLIPHRACTVAPRGDISKTALGNDFCKRAENQFLGFLGVNSLGGDEEGNLRYRVPYAPEEYTPILNKTLLAKCKKEGIPYREASVFSENTLYPLDVFESYLDNNKNLLDGKTFFLGEGAYFKEDANPHFFRVKNDDRQSIAIISSSKEYRLDMLNKLLLNLKKSPNKKINLIGVHCKELYSEFADLCDYNIYGKDLLNPKEALEQFNNGTCCQFMRNDLFHPDFEDMFTGDDLEVYREANTITFEDTIRNILSGNKESKMNNEEVSLYYFIIFDYEKHSEVIDGGSRIYRELATLLNDCNNNNIYSIFVTSNFGRLYTEYCAGYWMVGQYTADADTPKPFREETNPKLCKLVDLQKTYSAVYKPPMYEPPYTLT